MKNLNNFIPSFLNTSTIVSHSLETLSSSQKTHTHTPCPAFIGNTQRFKNRDNWILSLIFLVMFTPILVFGQDQVYFSETWTQDGGESALFYKNSSTTDNIGNVYMAGSAININNNHDIIIQKFDPDGGLLWEETFNGAANMDDFAADIFVDDNYNVFITGSSVKLAANDQDLVVLKYNSSGVFQWYSYYDNGGSPTPKDFGTSITGDNNGSVYVTGGSFGATSNTDFITLAIASNNGTQLWEKRYDYAALQDVAAKIKYDGNNLFVSGGSQINFNRWELATLTYNPLNGDQLYERRSQGNATQGIDEVYDLTVDDLGNVYIAGAVNNLNSGYDMSVYKLDPQLNILWEKHHDGYGADDKGKGVKVDDLGNVYLAGFVSNPNEGKNYSLLKYNSAGVLQWAREFNGQANLDDEAVQLVIANNQDIFVTGTARNNADSDFQTLGYKPNGELFTQAIFEGVNGLDDMPTGIAMDLTGNIIVVGKMGEPNGNYRDVTVKYSLYLKPFSPVIVNGEPSHNANEVIIRFDRSSVNYAAIDRKAFIAGNLSDFVNPSVVSLMNEKLKMKVGDLSTFKIFRRMTTADSLSVTRLGDTIKVDDFWATLSVFFPINMDINDVVDSLDIININMINYAQFNGLIERDNIPNDQLLSSNEQASLIPTSTYIDAHINVEQAWDIEVGQNNVKVGVFDDAIYWAHEDFGNGTYSGSKIYGGWDFVNHTHISNVLSPNSSHGTSCAGIIGALRNNGKGIAGIAGGDVDSSGNTGVQLFSMMIFDDVNLATETNVANAIVEGSHSGTYGYGLDIQNHSWKTFQPSPTLKRAVRTAWRNHSVFVTTRGNQGLNGNLLQYPGCYDDEMVISVGASGTNGEYKNELNGDDWWASSYGNNVDFIAPGTTEIITSLINPSKPSSYPNSCQSSLYPNYQCFNGSSAAAPHVAGVAALMYSKHNKNNGAPNNLATEDIENIMQKTAKDVVGGTYNYPQYYDVKNGWGLIDAHEALKKVNYPEYYVKHDDQLSNTPHGATLTQSNTNIVVLNSLAATDAGLAAGVYNASQYKLDWTFVEVLPQGHEIIDWWPLKAKSSGIAISNPVTGDYWVDASANINGNSISISAITYCWVAHNAINGPIINKFIPHDAPYTKFHYSLHVRNTTLSTDEETSLSNTVNIYPNPANDFVNFEFELNKFEDISLTIYDLQGKVIARPHIGQKSAGKHTISINTAHLSKGIYLVKMNLEDKLITKKIIKQ